MLNYKKSAKLDNVCYEIRGVVLREARRLEEEGHRVLKLNIGNPAAFELDVPEEIQQDVIYNMHLAQGYVESKGLFSARKAVMHYCQQRGIDKVDIDDIYLGNGVSELIVMSMQALLNTGDEVLIPAPDYPCGPPPSPCPAANRYITAVMSNRTGTRTLTTSRKRSPVAPAPLC